MRRRPTIFVALLAVAVPLLAACTSEAAEVAPTTTAAPTTVAAPATTTGTTADDATTTSEAASGGVTLAADGLGVATFGDDADPALAALVAELGQPDADSDWVDPLGTGAACPGSEVRFVTWGDLVVMFSDDTDVASGRRHFAAFTYGPSYGASIVPDGLATPSGVGVGSTVGELLEAHPDVVIHDAGELSGPSFWIESGLHGFLSGIEPADTIVTFVGGQACGE